MWLFPPEKPFSHLHLQNLIHGPSELQALSRAPELLDANDPCASCPHGACGGVGETHSRQTEAMRPRGLARVRLLRGACLGALSSLCALTSGGLIRPWGQCGVLGRAGIGVRLIQVSVLAPSLDRCAILDLTGLLKGCLRSCKMRMLITYLRGVMKGEGVTHTRA